jgi:hypothetical protein
MTADRADGLASTTRTGGPVQFHILAGKYAVLDTDPRIRYKNPHERRHHPASRDPLPG